MNHRLLYSICLLCLLAACREPVEQPSVPEDKMARIIADLAIAESATVGMSGFPKDSLQQIYYQQVLKMHSITLEEYERNLRLYANDVGKMESLTEQAEELVNPKADSTSGD